MDHTGFSTGADGKRRCSNGHVNCCHCTLVLTLDSLVEDARVKLANGTSAKCTGAELLEEVVADLASRFGGGFHPDTPPAEYVSLPAGVTYKLIYDVLDAAFAEGVDAYEAAYTGTIR